VKPVHQHDCDKCAYLGRLERAAQVFPSVVPNNEAWDQVFGINEKKEIDLYYCAQGSLPTVVARYSDDPDDYESGLAVADQYPDLAVAKKLAQARGLVE
jgi:hypothetical protein